MHPATPTVFRVHLSQSLSLESFLGELPSEGWGMRAVLVPVDLEPSSGFYPERQVRRLPLWMPGDVGGSACLPGDSVLTAIH